MIETSSTGNAELAAAFLSLLLVRGAGALLVDGRTRDGIGGIDPQLIADVRPPFLPASLLSAIEGRRDWQLTVTQFTADHVGGPAVVQAIALRWRLQPTVDGRELVIDAKAASLVRARIEAFPLRPTALVDAGTEVIALWRLDRPIDLTTCARLQAQWAAAFDAARDTVESDGSATGGRLFFECDPRRPIAFFGIVRDWDAIDRRMIDIAQIDPALQYTVDDIAAALPAVQEITR